MTWQCILKLYIFQPVHYRTVRPAIFRCARKRFPAYPGIAYLKVCIPPPPEMHRRPLRRHVSFVTFQKPELPPQMSNDSRARHLGRVYGAKYQSRSNASTRELFDPICQSLSRSYLVESTSRRHITRREVPRSRSGSRFVTSESYQ